MRKTAETLEAQAVRRKIEAEKNAQRTDIDEAMGEGGGDEEEDGESEDDNEDPHGTAGIAKRPGTQRRKLRRFYFRPGAVVRTTADNGRDVTEQTKILMARCVEGGTSLSLSGDLWSSDGMALFAIFGHCINQSYELSSCLLGLVSCATEHHTGDYIKKKTEEVLLTLGIVKV